MLATRCRAHAIGVRHAAACGIYGGRPITSLCHRDHVRDLTHRLCLRLRHDVCIVGTMAAVYDGCTMAAVYDVGTMAAVYDGGTMAAICDVGTMARYSLLAMRSDDA